MWAPCEKLVWGFGWFFFFFSHTDVKSGFVSRFPIAKATPGVLVTEKETLALRGGAGARICAPLRTHALESAHTFKSPYVPIPLRAIFAACPSSLTPHSSPNVSTRSPAGLHAPRGGFTPLPFNFISGVCELSEQPQTPCRQCPAPSPRSGRSPEVRAAGMRGGVAPPPSPALRSAARRGPGPASPNRWLRLPSSGHGAAGPREPAERGYRAWPRPYSPIPIFEQKKKKISLKKKILVENCTAEKTLFFSVSVSLSSPP